MATPVGHLLAGAFVAVALARGMTLRRPALVGALAAVSPDLDFVPGALLFGEPSRYHHTVSHTLAFALLAAAAGWTAARAARLRWAAITGLAYASHLVLDMLTHDDSPPHGIPLFWPLSTVTVQSPFAVLPSVPHGAGLVVSARNVELLVLELSYFGIPLAFALLLARRGRKRNGTSSFILAPDEHDSGPGRA